MPDSSYYRRRIPAALRRYVYDRDERICQTCRQPVSFEQMHCGHLRAASHGGPAIAENLYCSCGPCNNENGARDILDTRVTLREWQRLALPKLVEALTMQRFATLMAAPAAGKTIASAAVYDALLRAGLVHQLLVVVHRYTLVNQWRDALLEQCHLYLDTNSSTKDYGQPLDGMDGLVTTIQSWRNPRTVQYYQKALRQIPTLIVNDEVHHLKKGGLWASGYADIVGDIQTGLRAHVLNISGTLFRTIPGERIATVDYADVVIEGQPKIQIKTDFEIQSEELVKQGLLRAPNLWKIGAEIEMADLHDGTMIRSPIADLSSPEEQSAGVREFHKDAHCRRIFASLVLDKLKRRYDESGNEPVKALIVAMDIANAKDYRDELKRQMADRGLQPLVDLAVSDDREAHDILKRFRTQSRPGVLVTVNMAGEGYDCPEISVIGYASAVMTEMFIRQVLARGQRVTTWERDRLKRPLRVEVIVPNVADLVEHFRRVLTPMVMATELEEPVVPPPPPPPPRVKCPTCGTWHAVTRPCPVCFPPPPRATGMHDPNLEGVEDVGNTEADGYDPEHHQHDPRLIEQLEPLCEANNLFRSEAPAVAGIIKAWQAGRPFDPSVVPPSEPRTRSRSSRPMSPREEADCLRAILNGKVKWYIGKQNGNLTQDSIKFFWTDVKRAGGIGDLGTATGDQLRRALRYLVERIRTFCADTQTAPPADLEDGL